uniref:Uncharacterized protein n=1 Tax=Anguilla anguilla TaxID=7936 RepID=A0A0E9SG87_ANGAN
MSMTVKVKYLKISKYKITKFLKL